MIEEVLWPLCGGRSEYRRTPKDKILKHWIRHQAKQIREKELAQNAQEGADIRDAAKHMPQNLSALPHGYAPPER